MCYPAAELEHYNHAMCIPEALKSFYDFSVHGQSDILLFRFDLNKFCCFE